MEGVGNSGLTEGSRKAIILIHGWNPESDADSYAEPGEDADFVALKDNLQTVIEGSPDWQLFVYHWEKDADTGASFPNFGAAVHGTRAAESGHLHGQYLGKLIEGLTAHKIEKVHFIAHSAGSWVVRAATRHLLAQRGNSTTQPIKVQVTLLDPFIPGELAGISSSLSKAAMSGINEFAGANIGSIFRLENYFAEDTVVFGTQSTFDWRGSDLDENGKRVGYDGVSHLDPYGGHSGPIKFFADSVSASTPLLGTVSVFTRLALVGLEDQASLEYYGWRRSMFYREPIITKQPSPSVAVVRSGDPLNLTVGAGLRGTRLSDPDIKLRWEVSTDGVNWQKATTNSDALGDTFSFGLSRVADGDSGKRFRCVASTDAGSTISGEVLLQVQAAPGSIVAPTAPTSLTASAVSASQINLNWQKTSNNETGFKIERRNGSGAWAQVGTSGSNAFSSPSLAASTIYEFRVRACNAAGNSAYSNSATETTLATAGPVRQLTVTSVNPSGASLSYTPLALSPPVNGVLTYANGTQVTLTAPATANGNNFLRWEKDGAFFASTQAATLTMDGNHTMTMVFGPPVVVTQHNINATAFPNGTAGGGGAYSSGQTVTLSAIPAPGYHFLNWTLNANSQSGGTVFTALAMYSFQATGNLTLFANFVADSGGANIPITTTVEPAGMGTTTGAGNYANGQNAPLTATPVAGWEFGTWTENGTIVSFNSSFSYPVYQAHNYVAHFNPILSQNYTLAITAVHGSAIPNPSQVAYTPGSTVVVTATSQPGYFFNGWSGDETGTQNPLPVVMTKNKVLTANFVTAPPSNYTLDTLVSTVSDVSGTVGGTITKQPNAAFYTEGTQVVLTATPNAGTGHPGGNIALTGSVKNRGTGSSQAFKAYYRISNSSTVAPVIGAVGDAPMTDFTAIGETQEVTFTSSIAIPDALNPGNYSIWMLTDPEDVAGEAAANQTNNNIALPLTVLPDTVAPQIAITAPVSGDHFVNYTSAIDIAGTASDDVGVTGVTWTNDREAAGRQRGLETGR